MRENEAGQGIVVDVDEHSRRAGSRIIGLRRHREMTQQQLADATGMTRSAVWAIETGRRYLRLGEAADICAALKVDLTALVAQAPLVLETTTEVRFE